MSGARIPARAMALAVLASPLPLVWGAVLLVLLVNLPAGQVPQLATFEEYLRVAGFCSIAALVLAAVTGLGPALLYLRDPETPAVRWAFAGLVAGVASGILLALFVLVGLPNLVAPGDMRVVISTIFGVTIGFGFVSALLARLFLRRYRPR